MSNNNQIEEVKSKAIAMVADVAISSGKSFIDNIFYKIYRKIHMEEKATAEYEIEILKSQRAIHKSEFLDPKEKLIAQRKLADWRLDFENQDKVIKFAEASIVNNVSSVEKNIDSLRAILDESKSVSDEEMQKYLGKILAEEYNNPNSISRKSIQIIKTLTKRELELFSKYLSLFKWYPNVVPVAFFQNPQEFSEIGFNYDPEFLELVDLGLINATSISLPILQKDIPKSRFIGYSYFRKSIEFGRVDNTQLGQININVYKLSQSGIKLSQFVKVEENLSYTNWIIKHLELLGIELKLGL